MEVDKNPVSSIHSFYIQSSSNLQIRHQQHLLPKDHHNYNTPMLILLPPGASTQGSKAPFKMANSIPLNRCGTTIFGATAAAPWGKRNGAEIKLNERKRWGKQAKDEENQKKWYIYCHSFSHIVCKMKIRVVITHIHNYSNRSLKKRQIMRRKKG